MSASQRVLSSQVLWSSVQGPNTSNATVLNVTIANSTRYWTVTFPADSRQPINVLCHAPSSMCPLSSAPSCVSAPGRNSTSRNSSLLTKGNTSTCVAGSPFNTSQRYGLRVSCPAAPCLFITVLRVVMPICVSQALLYPIVVRTLGECAVCSI